jgi:cyclophilin family peptidyl-prolyl cis-trans isomerase
LITAKKYKFAKKIMIQSKRFFAILSLFLVIGFLLPQVTSAKKKTTVIEIQTELGNIYFTFNDVAVKHRDNFLKLTKQKFFDGTTFHRCIKNFVVQGGDPNSKDDNPANDGEGGPEYKGEAGTYKDPNSNTYTIDAEIFPNISHSYGAVAAAREGDNVNPNKRSSGSQFYIVIRKAGAAHLDGNYSVFGNVIQGMDVAEKIADQPKGAGDRPTKNINMKVKKLKLSDKKYMKKFGVAPQATSVNPTNEPKK